MLRTDEILSTVRMLQGEHLDVRAVTMGIDLNDCAGPDIDAVCQKLTKKIQTRAAHLVEICDQIGAKYQVPVVNKRIALSPLSLLLEGHDIAAAIELARAVDAAVEKVSVDIAGGFTALVERGETPGQKVLMQALPEVMQNTKRVCASLSLASTKAGINMDAVKKTGEILKAIADRTANQNGFGCAKLVVFANIPPDNPFMAGAYLGTGQGDTVINIGVSGPGVIKSAIQRLIGNGPASLHEIAEQIKLTAFRVTRVGELIGREVASTLSIPFGIVDLSLAPTPEVGDSVGEILEAMGISSVGGPGSTAALALLNDAVKKGGLFASSSVGGLSGAFVPVSEDAHLANAARQGALSLEKLEAMTSVCSVGIDMVLLPGDTPAETLSGIIADELAIGIVNNKTTAARLIPVPGKKAGDEVTFGGLFGGGPIMRVRGTGENAKFVRQGGQIPAPLHSLKN